MGKRKNFFELKKTQKCYNKKLIIKKINKLRENHLLKMGNYY